MRSFRSALPAFSFFVLLGGAVAVGYWLGGQRTVKESRIYTCSMHKTIRHEGPGQCPICTMALVPLDEVKMAEGTAITIDPVVVQNMGVRVGTVTKGPLHASVRAFGALLAAQNRQHDIALKVDGFVARLFADTEGMVIKAGEPLFELYSAELIVAQEELIAARRSGDAALLAGARQKLLLWDVPAELVDQLQQQEHSARTLSWRSPVGGVLLRRDVVQGAPAMKNQVLLRIVDLSVLWLDASLPESQWAAAQIGMAAKATLPALPGLELEGQVTFVAPTVDPVTRTATVRIELANANGALKPGMFARVQLQRTLVESAVLVPQEAVLSTGRRQLAWVAVGNGRFEPRELSLGPTGDGGVVQVLGGLQPGEPVVLSGQLLIDAESRMREGTQKLDQHGLLPGGALPVPPPLELSAATQAQVDAVLAAYLRLTDALAKDRHDADGWPALQRAATALTAAPEPAVQLPAGELDAAVKAAGAKDLETARIAMKAVGQAAALLFELARPGSAGATTLFVHHCPMREADWLQLDADTRNPYYGSAMPRCGEVRRQLPLRAAEGGR